MNLLIIQARLNSTRLPKKILFKLGNITVLDHVIIRAKKSKYFGKIVVAVPDGDKEEIIKGISDKSIEIFSGSENDVMSRYYKCGQKYSATTICRITSDCPFLDWRILDECYEKYTELDNKYYVANTCPPPSTFPDGMDVEIFPMEMLKTAYINETTKENREHVTFQFWKSSKYKSYQLNNIEDLSDIRLTIDYNEDYVRLKNIADAFCPNGEDLSLQNIVSLLKKNDYLDEFKQPDLRNSGWSK
jgi:spore coat polysaccharide biosynthesis protein SpsF